MAKEQTIEFPLMLVTIDKAWEIPSAVIEIMKKEKDKMLRLFQEVSEEHYMVWIFNSIEKLEECINGIIDSDENHAILSGGDFPVDRETLLSDREMIDFLVGESPSHFVISKKNWNASNLSSIAKLYGNKIVKSMNETAKENGWPEIPIRGR